PARGPTRAGRRRAAPPAPAATRGRRAPASRAFLSWAQSRETSAAAARLARWDGGAVTSRVASRREARSGAGERLGAAPQQGRAGHRGPVVGRTVLILLAAAGQQLDARRG